MFKKFLKTSMLKFLMVICIMTTLTSLVGCSNDKNNSETYATSTNATSSNSISENSTEDIIYNSGNIASIGNTSITNEKEINFNDEIKAMQYEGYSNTDNTNDASDLIFYVFDSKETATKAFDYVKTNLVNASDDNIHENYIIGRDKNAIGLIVNVFYYQTNNMIIYRTDYIGEPDSDKDESEFLCNQNNIRHEEIMNIW